MRSRAHEESRASQPSAEPHGPGSAGRRAPAARAFDHTDRCCTPPPPPGAAGREKSGREETNRGVERGVEDFVCRIATTRAAHEERCPTSVFPDEPRTELRWVADPTRVTFGYLFLTPPLPEKDTPASKIRIRHSSFGLCNAL